MREWPFDVDAVVSWVLSEAAREGTPLNVENRLEVRLDATWTDCNVSS